MARKPDWQLHFELLFEAHRLLFQGATVFESVTSSSVLNAQAKTERTRASKGESGNERKNSLRDHRGRIHSSSQGITVSLCLSLLRIVFSSFPFEKNQKMVLDNLLNAIIEGIAHITARILNHPSVQDAVAKSIAAGFQKICHSPDLHGNIDTAYATMGAHAAKDAEDVGRDLSRNMGHFWKGVFSSDDEGQSKEDGNNKEKKIS